MMVFSQAADDSEAARVLDPARACLHAEDVEIALDINRYDPQK
jgi:hypothetical protein